MQQQAQARSYTLDRQAAINGSTSSYQRITSTGAYVGTFTKAKALKAGTGAEGLEFTFVADTGAEAQYLSVYSHNRQGEPVYGLDQLNALMTCLRVREIAPEPATIKEWSMAARVEVDAKVQLYRALMNRPVGVLLQREQYRKADGTVGEKMSIVGCFESDTRRSARELLADVPVAEIADTEAAVAALRDKLLPDAGHSAAPAPVAVASATNGSADFDDDIPF